MKNALMRALSLLLFLCALLNILPAVSFAATIPSSALFKSEVAAEDAVSSSYYTQAAKGVVNGHDYLYLVVKGTKLMVYDIDTKQQVDVEELEMSTPRGCLVDENGIVWICGSTRGLYRYDPYSGKCTYISGYLKQSISNFYGLTGDGNGKLYFGTYADGYIGMYDTATGKFSLISSLLKTDPNKSSDIRHAGYGGLVYKDGYLYLGVDGDANNDGITTHALIKYDIANKRIVDQLDISHCLLEQSKSMYCLNLIDNILFGSIYGHLKSAITVDITKGDGNGDGYGDTMQFVTLKDLETGHTSQVTEITEDGKVYFVGYHGPNQTKGFVEYDVATKTSKLLKEGMQYAIRLQGGSMVTVEGDDRLPGESVMIPVNNETTGHIDLAFFNPQTNEYVVWESFAGTTGGAGISLRSPVTDPTGKYVYVGAYGNNTMSKYSVEEGKIVASFPTYGHQTDGTLFYNGYLYAGNYSACTITQIDPETYETTPLFALRYSVFDQCRMWTLVGGDNKIFAGTVPYSGYGGMLVWYDFDKKLTYVAAGPKPEDVYYADTSGLTNSTNITLLQYTWYNAVTGEVADFDDNDDGKDDYYTPEGYQRFDGPIPGQVINNLVYKDGYLYGTTSAYGSSGNEPVKSAVLFVYDVTAMQVIATYNLANAIPGMTALIGIIDQLAADPTIEGKFWGVVSSTLFSFTFDVNSRIFSVKEELSFGKNYQYSPPGNVWGQRDIIFDGAYMYVSFTRSLGVFMIRRSNPSGEYYYLSSSCPNEMTLGADGNLYWTTTDTDMCADLNVIRIAEFTKPLKEKAALEEPITQPPTPGDTQANNTSPQNDQQTLYTVISVVSILVILACGLIVLRVTIPRKR